MKEIEEHELMKIYVHRLKELILLKVRFITTSVKIPMAIFTEIQKS